jgi:hypothetical protein
MQDLILQPGPALIARSWRTDDVHESGRWHELDATDRAHEFLFALVTLDSAVTLGDIFRLLDASPVLKQVFRRNFSEMLCFEARKGPFDAEPSDSVSPEGIEFLELQHQWHLDTSQQTYSSTQRLQLHGVGFELQADAPSYFRKQGERIHWSVSLTPLRELLALPIRVNPELRVMEDDVNAKAFGDEILKGKHPEVTLGQVIDGVIYEISFHGGPQERAEFRSGLDTQLAEIKAGTAEVVSGDDIFDADDRPGFELMFEGLGGVEQRDVSSAMRQIDDDANAAAWLDKEFEGKVIVRPRFRDKTGREFRKTFSSAAR